jgi:hypothetical protein
MTPGTDKAALSLGTDRAAEVLDVPPTLAAALAQALSFSEHDIRLEPLYRGPLPDSCEVLLLRHRIESSFRMVLMYSPGLAPLAVHQSALRAVAAAKALGPALSTRVLQPLLTGEVAGRSYAVVPYLSALAQSRCGWVVQKTQVLPALLDWLYAAMRKTAMAVNPTFVQDRYERPLRALAELEALDQHIREAARFASDRLATSQWIPVQCLMHGDIWKGNLLLRPSPAGSWAGWSDRLVLIDWAGSRTDGYPIFDLAQASGAFRFSSARMRRELMRHCLVLRCEPIDCVGYVLAALGALLAKLEHFPMERLVQLVRSTYDQAAKATRPL